MVLFATYLKEELAKRCTANSSYSLRSLALYLQVSPGRISEWINQKVTIKALKAGEVLKQLNCSVKQTKLILEELDTAEYLTLLGNKENTSQIIKEFNSSQLKPEELTLVSKWYYYAIINLMSLKSFNFSSSSIAKSLGITVLQAEEAINTLLDFNILLKSNKGLSLNKSDISTSTDIPSQAIKNFHTQISFIAKKSLESVEIKKRDFTNMMMPTNSANLKLAKIEIAKFRRKMCRLLEKGDKTEVYNLSIQLFPITREPV